MTTEPRASLVEVEQVDRERAAKIIEWHNKIARAWGTVNGGAMQLFMDALPEAIRRGIWDQHEIPQLFARHRLEALRTQGDGDVRVACWNAAKKRGASDGAAMAFAEAVSENLAALAYPTQASSREEGE